MIKAAIFDMDGLLIDSERVIMHALIAAAADIGIDYTREQFVQLIGRAGPDSTRLFIDQLGSEAAFEQVMQGLDTRLAEQNYAFPIKPGVSLLLDHYQQLGVRLSVASSSPLSHITHRLEAIGILSYFEFFTSGQEVSNGKPAPDIYLLAMEKLGLQASDCIAFEDSVTGTTAAIQAGLKVVMVPDLKQPDEALLAQCYQVADSLDSYYQSITNT